MSFPSIDSPYRISSVSQPKPQNIFQAAKQYREKPTGDLAAERDKATSALSELASNYGKGRCFSPLYRHVHLSVKRHTSLSYAGLKNA
jgi:hypothetical protein